ncbi:hypothetical protein U0070_025533, partial [Myodes glareolus]
FGSLVKIKQKARSRVEIHLRKLGTSSPGESITAVIILGIAQTWTQVQVTPLSQSGASGLLGHQYQTSPSYEKIKKEYAVTELEGPHNSAVVRPL